MTAEQQRLALRRVVEEGFGMGSEAVIDEVMDPSLIEHQDGIEPGSPEGVKRMIRFLHTAFPDLRVTIRHETVDGDLAWCHFTAHGTHTGPFGHVPPTGRRMQVDVIDIARFSNGKLVEHWGVADRFSQVQQLGILPQRQAAAGAPSAPGR